MKRIISGMLFLSMLLTLSCADQGKDGKTDSTDSGKASDDATTEEVRREPDLPYTDCKGADFTYLARNPDGASYREIYIYAESENGEVVNDAIFRRNRQIEDKFNININMIPYIPDEMVANEVSKYVLSDDSTIDAVSYKSQALAPLGLDGYLADFNELKYVTPTSEYWDANAAEMLNIYGKLYVMPCDISMGNLSGAYFTYFNKRLIDEYKLDDPYALVDSNKWTLEKFTSMIKSVSRDLDGNGEMNEKDLYGLLSSESGTNSTFVHAIYSAGIQLIDRDSDGNMSIAPLNEKVVKIAEMFEEIIKDKKNAIGYETLRNIADITGYTNEFNYARALFANGQFLFIQNGMNVIHQFTDMADDFGIVPNPKFDEDQEKYYSKADRYGLMFAVPISASDLDRVGEIMEYSAWLSHETLLPAYYEVNLKQKKNRDERTPEMLDIVKSSIFYDLSDMLGVSSIYSIQDGFLSGSISSSFDSNKTALETQLENIKKNLNQQ